MFGTRAFFCLLAGGDEENRTSDLVIANVEYAIACGHYPVLPQLPLLVQPRTPKCMPANVGLREMAKLASMADIAAQSGIWASRRDG
jgi:hypothetical protein